MSRQTKKRTLAFRGKHAMLDISNLFSDSKTFLKQVSKLIYESTKSQPCKVVGKKAVLFDDTDLPGFASIILLNESHGSVHYYGGEIGLCSIDIFTCGSSNPFTMMNYVEKELKKLYPEMIVVKRHRLNRFAHHIKKSKRT